MGTGPVPDTGLRRSTAKNDRFQTFCGSATVCAWLFNKAICTLRVQTTLTTLDRDTSRNFFSHTKILILEVEYREMTLQTNEKPVKLQYASLHATSNMECLIAQRGVAAGHPCRRPQQLPLKLFVDVWMTSDCCWHSLLWRHIYWRCKTSLSVQWSFHNCA